MAKTRGSLAIGIAIIAGAIAISACGSDAPTAELECETSGFPCSFSEVPPEIIERTFTLGEEANAMVQGGATTAEAATMLEEVEDIAEVDYDESLLRFRIEGGRAMWIFTVEAWGGEQPTSRSRVVGTPVALRSPHPRILDEPNPDKKAILLSPYNWEDGDFDDATAAAAQLETIRSYQSRVDYRFNDTPTEDEVGFADWKSLGGHEVVYISTHGGVICEQNGSNCRGVLAAFTFDSIAGTLEGQTPEEKIKNLDERGVDYAFTPGHVDAVVLTAEFFTANYQGGLQDSLIYVNACEGRSTELADTVAALTGNNSVYVGWDKPVWNDTIRAATVKMLEELGNGHTVNTAFERLGPLGTGRGGTTLGFEGAADSRIRDLPTILNPETGQPLARGDSIAISGGMGDGENDRVPYMLAVDGIKADEAAVTSLTLTIDGEEMELPLDTGTPSGESWTLEGEIELPYDVVDATEVDIGVTVELPEGGESTQESWMVLTGQTGGEWTLTIDYSWVPVDEEFGTGEPKSATAELLLAEADFQVPDSDEIDLEVIGGTVVYDPSHLDPRYCRVIADSIRFEVTPERAGFSRVSIDTSTSPQTFTAFVNIQGPEYTGTQECRAGTGDDAPEGFQEPEDIRQGTDLLLLNIEDDDARQLDNQGNSYSGSWYDESPQNPTGSLTEVTFTLTRSD